MGAHMRVGACAHKCVYRLCKRSPQKPKVLLRKLVENGEREKKNIWRRKQ